MHHKFEVFQNEDVIQARLDTAFEMMNDLMVEYIECDQMPPMDLQIAFQYVLCAQLLYQNYRLVLQEEMEEQK